MFTRRRTLVLTGALLAGASGPAAAGDEAEDTNSRFETVRNALANTKLEVEQAEDDIGRAVDELAHGGPEKVSEDLVAVFEEIGEAFDEARETADEVEGAIDVTLNVLADPNADQGDVADAHEEVTDTLTELRAVIQDEAWPAYHEANEAVEGSHFVLSEAKSALNQSEANLTVIESALRPGTRDDLEAAEIKIEVTDEVLGHARDLVQGTLRVADVDQSVVDSALRDAANEVTAAWSAIDDAWAALAAARTRSSDPALDRAESALSYTEQVLVKTEDAIASGERTVLADAEINLEVADVKLHHAEDRLEHVKD